MQPVLASSAAAASTGGALAPLPPGPWLGMGRERPLHLPVAPKAAQHYCIDFFVWRHWQRVLIRVALGLSRWRGETGGPCDAMLTALAADSQHWPLPLPQPVSDGAFLAMRSGSPGPLQKDSLLAVDDQGRGLFFAKAARGERAAAMVLAEARHLRRLNAINALRGRVPMLLHEGVTALGSRFFAASVSPTLHSGSVFGAAHSRFLVDLGNATCERARYMQSAEWRRIQGALAQVQALLPAEVHAVLADTAGAIERRLASWSGPMVMVHRDFAPWNIRSDGDSVFVFDWEYAAEGGNPAADYFHFHLTPRMLARRRPPGADEALDMLYAGMAFVRLAYPRDSWSSSVIAGFLLAYLVDLLLFYVVSDESFNPRHPVPAACLNLLRCRKLWLPVAAEAPAGT